MFDARNFKYLISIILILNPRYKRNISHESTIKKELFTKAGPISLYAFNESDECNWND